MKKFIALLTKKSAQEWIYKKLGQLIFHTYSLTYSKKDTSVLLKAINVWKSS